MTSPGAQTKLTPEMVANVVKQHLDVENNVVKYTQQLADHANEVHGSSGSSMTKVALQQAEELREKCRSAVAQPLQQMTKSMEDASSNIQQTDQDVSQAVSKASQGLAAHIKGA